VRVIADVRTLKKLSLSLLAPPDLGIHPSKLLPKIPTTCQEEKFPKFVALLKPLFSLLPLVHQDEQRKKAVTR
jgi:hypothetical protein